MSAFSNESDIRRFDWAGIYSANEETAINDAFAEDGFLIIDDFASDEDCKALKDQAEVLIDGFDERTHQVVFSASGQSHAASDYFMSSAHQVSCFLEAGAVDDKGQLTKPKSQAINKIGHALHDLDPVYSKFSRHENYAKLISMLGMSDPLLLQSMVICKQPFIGGEVNSHQDSTFLYTSPESCIGLWLALEPATKENGCLWAGRGGHHSPLKSRFHKVGDEMVMSQLHEDDLAECTTPLEADAGTLVVLHGRLPHLSHENTSPTSRYAYALHLIDGACDYAEDNWLQRPADFPLKGFSPSSQ